MEWKLSPAKTMMSVWVIDLVWQVKNAPKTQNSVTESTQLPWEDAAKKHAISAANTKLQRSLEIAKTQMAALLTRCRRPEQLAKQQA